MFVYLYLMSQNHFEDLELDRKGQRLDTCVFVFSYLVLAQTEH